MKFKFSKQLFFLCLLVTASALPAVFLREFSPINELNYIALAQDALDAQRFFSFYENGVPYTERPPLYLWICMLAILFDGMPTNSILLLLNVFSLLAVICLLDYTFGGMLQRSYRNKAAIIIVSMPFMITAALLCQPIVLFALLVTAASCFIKLRAELILYETEPKTERGHIAIPICMFLSVFTNGVLGILIPVFTLLLVLVIMKKTRFFPAILPLRYFIIILVLLLLWFILTLAEAGWDYAATLFFRETFLRLIGIRGSSHNPIYYFSAFWILSSPLGLGAFYAAFKLLWAERRQIACAPLFAVAMPISSLILLSIPSSKNVTYVFACLPSIAYFMVYYNQKYGTRDKLLKLTFVAGLLPFASLFFAYFYVKNQIPALRSIYVISALLFLMLFSALAIFKVVRSSAIEGVATFAVGVMVMCFTVGFAMPEINGSVSYEGLGRELAAKVRERDNYTVCHVGINNPWVLRLYEKNLKLQLSTPDNINLDYCRGNFRIIGRSVLRAYPELNSLRRAEGAGMCGDTLLIEPR